MVQTIAIEQLTLYDLERQFGLQAVEDAQFFHEWQQNALLWVTANARLVGDGLIYRWPNPRYSFFKIFEF